ncbi:MAG TPA: GNAT family N-acetyltransferase [Ktedonobacterales bacterium]|jgi:beta-N-acetylhexosaminidase
MAAVEIRPYDPQRDALPAYALWQQTLGHLWSLPYDIFHAVTVGNPVYRTGDHFVALADNELVGLVATQLHQQTPAPQGHLMFLLVAPTHQRRGIGRSLHEQALARLSQRGAAQIQLGGGYYYFWQGVPANLPAAWPFFQACGWHEVERSFDLVRDLADYTTPPHIYARLNPTITIAQATSTDAEAILAFEARHFPHWLRHYQNVLNHRGHADVVLAKDAQQGIVGASFVLDPRAAWWDYEIRWRSLLGENTGGVGPLGVVEPIREQGIGLALAARVTELLQQRGIQQSYIGWTWLVDWYGRLGYRVWQAYRMSWRKNP